MSSNPHNTSNQDCIVLAIYGQFKLLAFARPGDKIWKDIFVSKNKVYDDVIYYKEKFYAVDFHGVVFVCDIDNVNVPKATIIACIPSGFEDMDQKYLVESSGFLLLVIRFRSYPKSIFDDEHHIDLLDCHSSGFSIFRLDECHGDKSTHNYYKPTQVDSLGDNDLFIGYNASVSLPSSKCVKADYLFLQNVLKPIIYFSEDNFEYYASQPYGGGPDLGIFNVESNSITSHYASEFMYHLTPPIWFI